MEVWRNAMEKNKCGGQWCLEGVGVGGGWGLGASLVKQIDCN